MNEGTEIELIFTRSMELYGADLDIPDVLAVAPPAVSAGIPQVVTDSPAQVFSAPRAVREPSQTNHGIANDISRGLPVAIYQKKFTKWSDGVFFGSIGDRDAQTRSKDFFRFGCKSGGG